MLNLNKHTQKTKSKPKPTCKFKNCSHRFVCISLCAIVVHNSAQNNFDYFSSEPPDSHRSQMLSIGGEGHRSTTSNAMARQSVDWMSWKWNFLSTEDGYRFLTGENSYFSSKWAFYLNISLFNFYNCKLGSLRAGAVVYTLLWR